MHRNRMCGSVSALLAMCALSAHATATINVGAFGDNGWKSSDTRTSTGVNLRGVVNSHAGLGGTYSVAHDIAISSQIKIVAEGSSPSGTGDPLTLSGTDLGNGALQLFATDQNAGKANMTRRDMTNGFGPSNDLLGGSFFFNYRQYTIKDPTTRIPGMNISVLGNDAQVYTFSYVDLAHSATFGVWTNTAVDNTTPVFLYGPGAPGGAMGTDKPVTAWASDPTWGPILFGGTAKVVEVGFTLGSSQRQAYTYLDWVETSLLDGGERNDFAYEAPGVTMTANECYKPNAEVIVEIRKSETATAAAGGQFFLSYDISKLQFLSADPGDAPYTLEIHETPGSGVLDYAVGDAGFGPGTTAATVMARIKFKALAEVCAGASLVTFRSHMPPSRLSDSFAAEVAAAFSDLGALTIDGTAPVITYCPPNTGIECDVAATPANTNGPATATDTCDGAPAVTYSDTVVANVTPVNGNGWTHFATLPGVNTPGGTGTTGFVAGPSTPPLGSGSIRLFTNNNGSQSGQVRTNNWIGTPISALTELKYSTYIQQNNGQQAPYLTIWVDTNNDNVWDDRLHFEPAYSAAGAGNPNPHPYQPLPTLNTWQTWDALHGMWYADSLPGPGSNAKSLATYLLSKPNAKIANSPDGLGGIRIASGFASVGNVFETYVDNFRIATASSGAVYNFEASNDAFPCVPEVITRTWKATDCAGNFSTCEQTITRTDTTPPSITCPGDISVNADAGGCTALLNPVLGANWSTFADGETVFSGGNMYGRLSSIAGNPFGYSGLRYTATTPYTLASVTSLGMDYMMVQGCLSAGSPRFVFAVDTDNNGVSNGTIICHVPAPPSFSDCPPLNQWFSTGNLISHTDARWEISAALGGGPYRTHAQVLATWGTAKVLTAYLVSDSSFNGNDDMLVDNVDINGSVQTFSSAAASDNCSPTVTMTGVRDDAQPLNAPYPSGVTTIEWTATDCAGNTSAPCYQTVTVSNQNIMNATVELVGVASGPFTRCITFDFYDGACATSVDVVMTFTGGVGTAAVPIPCGAYTCASARDKLHTLRNKATAPHFFDAGITYTAMFVNDGGGSDALVGGNLNDDQYVDILDFGGFVGQFNAPINANTTCSTPAIHADITGDSTVDIQDYSIISTNFLKFREADCCSVGRPGPGDGPVTDISVFELAARGEWALAKTADLNRDGRLNVGDVEFMAMYGVSHCPADFNNRGGATVDDIFVYLNSWFAQQPATDFDDNRVVAVDDIFAFLNTWFLGCN